MRTGAARTMHYKQIPALSIADDFELPTCDHCGERFIDARTAKRLDAHLEARYTRALADKTAASIESLSEFIKQQELEQLMGLSQGYLSKVKKARKDPSPALVGELMLLAVDPKRRVPELRKLWAGAESKAKL
jgi:transcriptional regulator with XRE-family HTH domain